MLIDLNRPIASVYCERTSPDFWAEPLNAITSLLIIFVTCVGFAQLRRKGLLSPSVLTLMLLALAIGVGSFLLHTYATPWAEIADVLPIWAFVVVYGLLVLRRLAPDRFNLPVAVFLGLGVFGSGVVLSVGHQIGITSPLSGSGQYIPAVLMIAGVIWFLWKYRYPSLVRFGLGVGLFGLALTFRSIDLWACNAMPNGTHFLWHIVNCLVFWYLIKAYASQTVAPELPAKGAMMLNVR